MHNLPGSVCKAVTMLNNQSRNDVNCTLVSTRICICAIMYKLYTYVCTREIHIRDSMPRFIYR